MTGDRPTRSTGEVDDPVYSAYFWDNPGVCDPWEVAADIDQVLEWVRLDNRGQPNSLWAVVRSN